jgi:sugar O-acyltransferase (sialic acid O-acetyltransferase NeuD family)
MTTPLQRIVIVGAGAQGAIVADILEHSGEPAIGFVDDTPALLGTSVLGLPVLAPIAGLSDIAHDAIVVAIGDNHLRRTLVERLVAAGERLTTAVHPFSSVAPSTRIGDGSMISAGAIVLPRALVGRSVILNTKSSVDHDTAIGDFAHIACGATVGGRVHIGEETLIGLGASVASGMSVGARTIIGAGGVVVGDIPDEVIAFGVPARVRSQRS